MIGTISDAELPYRITLGSTWIIGYAIRFYYERQARGVQRVSATTHRALGRNWSGKLEIAAEHQLVVVGPYRRVRHPMYTALFCMALAYSLLSANWIVAGANMVAVTLMYLARVSDEEQMLIDQFGDAYRAYMQRTGRLIPKL